MKLPSFIKIKNHFLTWQSDNKDWNWIYNFMKRKRIFFLRQIMHGNTSIVLSLCSLYCLTPCEQRTHNWNCKNNPGIEVKTQKAFGNLMQRCALEMVVYELSEQVWTSWPWGNLWEFRCWLQWGQDFTLGALYIHWAGPAFRLWESLTPSLEAGGRFSSWLHLWILVKGIAFGPPHLCHLLKQTGKLKTCTCSSLSSNASSRALVTDLELKLVGNVVFSWGSTLLKWNQFSREMGNFMPACRWLNPVSLKCEGLVSKLQHRSVQRLHYELKLWVLLHQFIAK